ncbi:MAG TPA: glycosyltransferase family 2 protein, partial [Thermoanaerobaculia bacterium]
MASRVSVVIAALNDEAWIAAAVDSAFGAGMADVIVSDGGSADRTREIAAAHRARVITSLPMRSRQFNIGAKEARHDTIVFLHADTTLPPGAADAVSAALQRFEFGGFRISFAENVLKLRVAASMINLRTRITRCPWGDQAQFIRRAIFLRDGGYREIPLMEDYELATRMKRNATILPLAVTTSGRRFLEKGVLR